MSFKSKLSVINQCFVFVGGGSIKYSGNKWIFIKYLCRLLLICIHVLNMDYFCVFLKTLDNRNMSMDQTALVLITCTMLRCAVSILASTWRLFTDDLLSTALSKIENVYDKMVNSNVVASSVKKRSVWLIVTIFLLDYFITSALVLFFITQNDVKFNHFLLRFGRQVKIYIGLVNERFISYEYYVLIIFVQWALYKINEKLEKPSTSVREFLNINTLVVECLQDLNKYVYGAPVLFNIIMNDTATLINAYFTNVFMPSKTMRVRDWLQFSCIVFVKLLDLLSLYYLAYITEKEINRTSFILNKRFVVETNPQDRRKISFFLLRRKHENFHFQLCGYFTVSFKQLLFLLSKALAFLIIQIQFKLK